MVEEQNSHILIVEDNLDIADMLSAYLRVQGYSVTTANWGEDGVKSCQSHRPNLVILDINLPDIDGFEVARKIRTNQPTQDIPIIFLTEKSGRVDRLTGLELQADDYITKPFDIQELRLRVRNALLRMRRGSHTNPVTGIPEGAPVDECLEKCLSEAYLSLMVISLKNLHEFSELYGFVASDDLLRAVTLMIQDSIQQICSEEDFLGHLSMTDFVIITQPSQVTLLSERIRNRLEQSFEYFYRNKDRDSDVLHGKNIAVQIRDLLLQPDTFQHLEQLRTELEQMCNQENH
jgi:CheY-like chemotaxis protein